MCKGKREAKTENGVWKKQSKILEMGFEIGVIKRAKGFLFLCSL